MPRRPFVIVADLRTGSTLLSSTLNCHPHARCYGELFHVDDFPDNQLPNCDRTALSGAELIDQALATPPQTTIGFRAMVFLPTADRPQWADAWDHLARLADLRVIYLTRNDRIAQYASVKLAEQTGIYHPHDNDPLLHGANRPQVMLDPQELATWIADRDTLLAHRRQQLVNKPTLEITYEQLTTHWTPTIQTIQQFLELPPHPLEQAKHKQETRPLEEVVSNYEELRGSEVGSRKAEVGKEEAV